MGSKLHTVVRFPTTGLDMTPFLSTRDQQSKAKHGGPSSRSSKTLPGRSVHFEDERTLARNKAKRVSSAGAVHEERRARFLWKKQKKPKQSDDQSEELNGRSSDGEKSPPGASPTTMPKADPLKGASSRSAAAYNPLSLPGNVDLPRLENRYDLYAVCNHHGSMTNGHYTAFCKNPVDGNWYCYDDECVHAVTESQLVSNGAYLLFYVRQELVTSSPFSSSASSTSSSTSSNHWIHHMPRFTLDLGDFTEETSPRAGSETPHTGVRPNSACSVPPSAVGVSPSSNEDVFSAGPSRVSYPHPTGEFPAQMVAIPPRNDLHSNPPPYQPTLGGNPPPTPRAEVVMSPRHSSLLAGRHPSLKLGKIRHTSNQGDISPIAVRRAGSFHDGKHMEVRRSDTVPTDYTGDSYRASLAIGPTTPGLQYSPEHFGHIATPRAWHASAAHLVDGAQSSFPVGQTLSRSVYFTPSSSDHESCV